jgi:hypothetical protein
VHKIVRLLEDIPNRRYSYGVSWNTEEMEGRWNEVFICSGTLIGPQVTLGFPELIVCSSITVSVDHLFTLNELILMCSYHEAIDSQCQDVEKVDSPIIVTTFPYEYSDEPNLLHQELFPQI